MNLITFNEHFAAVTAAEGRTRFEKACVAPLFDYPVNRMHVQAAISDLAKNSGMDKEGYAVWHLPFAIFRAEFTLYNRPGEDPVVRYQAMIMADSARIYFRILNRDMKRHLFCLELLSDGHSFSVYQWVERDKKWSLRVGNISPHNLSDDDAYFELYRTLIGAVVAFGTDAMSPTLHMASVEPNEPGRSVQWVKARTHYTFISHGHPANSTLVGHGARVSDDRHGELTRMAHSRRAHYKTLKHERFRFKRGQQIFVRATWCGPKEWKDAGGKQIYRILDPSDWKPGQPIIKNGREL